MSKFNIDKMKDGTFQLWYRESEELTCFLKFKTVDELAELSVCVANLLWNEKNTPEKH